MSVGLGLGDFCGVIAVCRESGGESVVADADGERYTPSVVSIGEGGVVVSLSACSGCFRYTTQCARAERHTLSTATITRVSSHTHLAWCD